MINLTALPWLPHHRGENYERDDVDSCRDQNQDDERNRGDHCHAAQVARAGVGGVSVVHGEWHTRRRP